MQELLKHGANTFVNYTVDLLEDEDDDARNEPTCDQLFGTPLRLAILRDRIDIVSLLWESGAELDLIDEMNFLPLDYVLYNTERQSEARAAIGEFLLSNGVDIWHIDGNGISSFVHLLNYAGFLVPNFIEVFCAPERLNAINFNEKMDNLVKNFPEFPLLILAEQWFQNNDRTVIFQSDPVYRNNLLTLVKIILQKGANITERNNNKQLIFELLFQETDNLFYIEFYKELLTLIIDIVPHDFYQKNTFGNSDFINFLIVLDCPALVEIVLDKAGENDLSETDLRRVKNFLASSTKDKRGRGRNENNEGGDYFAKKAHSSLIEVMSRLSVATSSSSYFTSHSAESKEEEEEIDSFAILCAEEEQPPFCRP